RSAPPRGYRARPRRARPARRAGRARTARAPLAGVATIARLALAAAELPKALRTLPRRVTPLHLGAAPETFLLHVSEATSSRRRNWHVFSKPSRPRTGA